MFFLCSRFVLFLRFRDYKRCSIKSVAYKLTDIIHLFIENPDLFEGDMVLTEEQIEAALKGDISKVDTRGAFTGSLWTNGVPYVIDRSVCKYPIKEIIPYLKNGKIISKFITSVIFEKKYDNVEN